MLNNVYGDIKMKIKDGFAMRNIAGNNIVVPIGKNALDFNGMITLNETGGFLWNCFQNDISIDDAAKMLENEYEVSFEQAKSDAESFVNKLKENDLIV